MDFCHLIEMNRILREFAVKLHKQNIHDFVFNSNNKNNVVCKELREFEFKIHKIRIPFKNYGAVDNKMHAIASHYHNLQLLFSTDKESIKFTYIRQKIMLGLGHAILTGEPLIGDEPFAVILADDLCDNNSNDGLIAEMVEIYNQYKCSVIAIEEVPMNQTKKYGIISGELIQNSTNLYQVFDMIEKPDESDAPSNMGIIGRYILTPDIFKILKKIKPDDNGEIQITNALNIQAKQGNVLAYKFKGRRFDCGSVKGFIEANNYFDKK